MATYPLKVKDGAGNVHTVGDPRIGAAAGDIPQASVNGLVAALAAKVGTSDSRLSDTRTPTDNTVSTAKLVDGAVTSAKIADGTIVNADVNAAAAIALSKLATGALPSGITVASTNLVDGTIVDADVNAAAAIAQSKISGLTTDLAAKAPLASPALTGTPTVNGTAITSLSGMKLVTATSFTTASVVNIDNCFSSTYDNYLLTYRLMTASASAQLRMQYRAGGSNLTLSNYYGGIIYNGNALGINGVSLSASPHGVIGQTSATYAKISAGAFHVFSPYASAVPNAVGYYIGHDGTNTLNAHAAFAYWDTSGNTNVDGLSLAAQTGTMTGILRVYGYNNS